MSVAIVIEINTIIVDHSCGRVTYCVTILVPLCDVFLTHCLSEVFSTWISVNLL